jgi:hypothetical protein
MRSDSSGVKVDNTVISLYLSHLKLLSLQTGKAPQARQLLSRLENRLGFSGDDKSSGAFGGMLPSSVTSRSSRGFLFWINSKGESQNGKPRFLYNIEIDDAICLRLLQV